VDPEDLSRALVPRLEEHFGKGRESDLGIIFILGRISDSSAAEALARLEQRAAGKEIKKEIRRSLFKLAQKGISVARSGHGETPARRTILNWDVEIEGYLSSVDGAGGRLVWLAKPQAGSGIQLLQGMVSDREGLQHVGGTVIRRKELRQMIQEIKEKHGVTMVSIPWEYGDRVLYEANERRKTLGDGSVENFSSLRAVFTSARPKELAHPVYDRVSSEEARSGAWRELSRQLLDEPEFRPWILDEDWVRSYLQQLQEAQESRLVLNPLQKEERLAGIVREAVRTIFAGESVKILQRRMEDMALYLFETGRLDKAKLALAVALQFKNGDPGLLDISFLTGLAQKSFAFYTSQEETEKEEEPSLIVKP
jgi:hypothetical protein